MIEALFIIIWMLFFTALLGGLSYTEGEEDYYFAFYIAGILLAFFTFVFINILVVDIFAVITQLIDAGFLIGWYRRNM